MKSGIEVIDIVNLDDLPNLPGVYKFKSYTGKIIYVGASKNLKKRVSSYFKTNHSNPRLISLLSEIVYVEFEIIKSGNLAFLRERELINEHKPKYNVRLLDDKQYPFLVITTSEKYPRINILRNKKENKDLYFERQSYVKPLKKSLKQLRKIFPICDCYKPIIPNKKKRPCLNYDLKLCTAPCIGKIKEKDYKQNVENLISFLNGDAAEILESWSHSMINASENMEYEKAALLRNQINALKNLTQERNEELENAIDVVGYKESNKSLSLVILNVINGAIVQKHEYYYKDENYLTLDEILLTGLKEHYIEHKYFPQTVLLPKVIIDVEILFEWMNDVSHKNLSFQVLSNISENKWIKIAQSEATKLLERNYSENDETEEKYKFVMSEIQDIFKTKDPINLIECIDISTLQGTHTVGSIVAFKNGNPYKTLYRRYKVKLKEVPNDVGSMKEVLTRHFIRKNKDNLPFPDLLLIDGGKTQLSAVKEVFNNLDLTIPFVGIAKKQEELIFPDRESSLLLDLNSQVLILFVALRNEAHRFAITYNRKLREKSTLESELDHISGIGKKKQSLLLIHFKTIDRIRKATKHELQEIKGLTKKNIDSIYDYFNG